MKIRVYGFYIFLAIVSIPSMSVAVQESDVSKMQANAFDHLDSRVKTLEGSIDRNLTTLRDVANLTIESTKRYADYLSLGFVILGLALSALTILGFNEIRRVTALHRELDQKSKTIENELYSITYVARAIPKIVQSDVTNDKAKKRAYAEESWKQLEQAEKAGYKSAVFYNWKGYVLKRCERLQDALFAAEQAYNLAETGSYEQARALYNCACYLSLLSRPKEAIEKLSQAIKAERSFLDIAKNDEDIESIRRNPDTNLELEKLLFDTNTN